MVMGLTALAALVLLRQDDWRALAIPTVLIGYLLLRHEPVWMVALASAQLMVLAIKIGVYVVQQRVQRARTRVGTP
jgi:hypothetical protein